VELRKRLANMENINSMFKGKKQNDIKTTKSLK